MYAVHALDAERDEDGKHSPGGIIGAFQHCNEIITTNSAWRCWASDNANSKSPPAGWNDANFDDSTWERATVYGTARGHHNHWNDYSEHLKKTQVVNPNGKHLAPPPSSDSNGLQSGSGAVYSLTQ